MLTDSGNHGRQAGYGSGVAGHGYGGELLSMTMTTYKYRLS